jgi:hypothetical protein
MKRGKMKKKKKKSDSRRISGWISISLFDEKSMVYR